MAIVLTGPSGCGKSTLEAALEEVGFYRTISFTTRPMRAGDKNGKTYWFVTPEEFRQRFNQNMFAEFTKHAGNFYGVAKKDITASSVMVVNFNGLKEMRRNLATDIPLASFYLDIPLEIRVERMKNRGDSMATIQERIAYEEDHFKDPGSVVDYILHSTDLQENLQAVLSANERFLENLNEHQVLREMAAAALR